MISSVVFATPVCELTSQPSGILYDLVGVNGQAIGIDILTSSPFISVDFNLCDASLTSCKGTVCAKTKGGETVTLCGDTLPEGNFLEDTAPQAGAFFSCTGALNPVEGIVASVLSILKNATFTFTSTASTKFQCLFLY
jgi:hypothetical protein